MHSAIEAHSLISITKCGLTYEYSGTIRRKESHRKGHLLSSGDHSEVSRIHFVDTRGLQPETDQNTIFWDELVNDLSHGSKDTLLLQHGEADSAILVRANEKYSAVLGFSEDQTICATHLEVFLRLTKLKHVNTQL